MKNLDKTLFVIAVIALELGLLYADGIAFIGFTSADNVEAPFAKELSVSLMCIGDLIAFVCSWLKPKIAGIVLASVSAITLLLSLTASDRHSLGALWFSGGVFWITKFLLSYIFYSKSHKVFSPTAIT